MKKILYFEGAGMFLDEYGEVGNCRIRTAFTNDEGTKFYLEINGWGMSKEWRKRNPDFKNVPIVGWIDHCHEITGGSEDCNEHRHEIARSLHFPFTLDEILCIVNERLGCSFDAVAVAPKNAGYRVFGGYVKGVLQLNYGDEFILDEATTRRVDEIEAHWKAKQEAAGQKHPCVGVWRDENDPCLVHVNNFNKSGLGDFDYRVDVEDWRETETGKAR